MAQDKILKFLYNKRIENNKYYSVPVIAAALNARYQETRHQIGKLIVYGFLENDASKSRKIFSQGGVWKRNYRLKNKHLVTVRRMIESVNIREGVPISTKGAVNNSITG